MSRELDRQRRSPKLIELLVILLQVKCVLQSSEHCINDIKAIFSGRHDTLHIVTNEKYYIFNQLKFARLPYFNLHYESMNVHKIGKRIKEQIDRIVDIDFYDEYLFAIRADYDELQMMQIDIVNDSISSDTITDLKEHNLVDLKSFVFWNDKLIFYTGQGADVKAEHFRFDYQEGSSSATVRPIKRLRQKNTFVFELDKVAHLNSGVRSLERLTFIFVHGLKLYLTKDFRLQEHESPRVILDVNRLTNCPKNLCYTQEISGIWFLGKDNRSNDHHAIIVNNNYFLVPNIVFMNGKSKNPHAQ